MVFLIGTLIIAAAVVLGLFVQVGSPELFRFFDLPSLIMVVAPAVVFSIASSWKQFKLSWKLVFSNEITATREEILKADAALNALGVICLLTGIMTMIIGQVLMLMDLSDARLIGSNLAMAVLAALYGALFRLLCFLAGQRIRNQLPTHN